EVCDGRLDQYALAATLYDALAGRPPFVGPTPAAVFIKHTTKKAIPLDRANPALSPTLARAVERGLAKSPAERYRRCGELAQAVLAAMPAMQPQQPAQVPRPTHASTVAGTPLPVKRRVTDETSSAPRKAARPVVAGRTDPRLLLWLVVPAVCVPI